ncbi:MAG: hypothetical protein ACRD20_15510 [Terriglobales bacterium]
MSVSRLRHVACGVLITMVPVLLWAADSSPAMLYARGTAWINGSPVPRTSAVFPGDMVQTRSDSVASINASGSSVVVLADSLVKFEGPAVGLEHGSLTVATSKGLATHAGEITVVPASNGWTQFEVKHASDGTVQIVAQKGDVNVSDGSSTSTLAQGNQTTVDDSAQKKKKKRKGGGAVPASSGPILDSPIVIYGGAAAVGGLLTWVLLQGGTPVSAAAP